MKAIILAAGKGKRLLSEQSDLPKVLRTVNGRPLIRWVLDSLSFIPPHDIVVVGGYRREKLFAELGDDYSYAVQEEQFGTGHAVNSAKNLFANYDGDVLVCYGDMPLLTGETFKDLCTTHKKSGSACTLLSGVTSLPLPYGRIIRNANGIFQEIIEERDCTEEQKQIRERNIGVYVFDSKPLFSALLEVKTTNTQSEYYLTDVPGILLQKGLSVGIHTITDDRQMPGVNTPEELSACEAILRERVRRQ